MYVYDGDSIYAPLIAVFRWAAAIPNGGELWEGQWGENMEITPSIALTIYSLMQSNDSANKGPRDYHSTTMQK